MARYRGPKDKVSRREGVDLFDKGTKLTRLSVPPGVHGPKGIRRRPSQYRTQLREKQKIKSMYGVLEKQFRRYVEMAVKRKGNTGEELVALLEKRLDNTVFRLGFAPTRPAARQMVSHRNVVVNNKKLNIPSYQVKVGDVITLTKKAQEIPATKKLLQEKDGKLPGWLKKKAIVGKVDRKPTIDDISELISPQDIVEFYSR